MGKKYEFTGETKEFFGKTLHQIRALVDIGEDVKAGDLGGWIENEENLSQEDHAWVFGNARVFDNAWVFGNAWVSGDAKVSGDARVFDNARVFGDAKVSGDARVFGDALVFDNAWVFGKYDHIIIGPMGSRNGYTSFCRAKDGSTIVACGCFRGNIDEFDAAVKKTHGDNEHGKAYMAAIQFVKSVINTEAVKDD